MAEERFFGIIGKVFRPVFYFVVIIIFYNSVTWVSFGDIPIAQLTLNQAVGGVAKAGFLFFLVWLIFNPKDSDPERWAAWGGFGVVVLAGIAIYTIWVVRHG